MIDEKKLIEEMRAKYSEIFESEKIYGDESHEFRRGFSFAMRFVESQPEVGEWIPVSERLPEDGVDVLVWFEYFRYGNYNRLFQTIGISYIYDGEWSGFVNGESGWHQLSIIAWQPLPEAYQPKGGE